ncbi:MAG: phosphoribosylformylglycinamidine cyclo-ligase [Gammaproteobacteria bacterium]|nr:phosphoribosylformylglycinamidine cyclo-ligase [Gammaproteobacteria bacterium]
MTKNKNKYKDIGVDIDEGQKFIEDIKNLTKKPITSYSLSDIGGFSGYVETPSEFSDPVYALACDGVGTKIKIGLMLDNLKTIGIDLVAMCVNDLISSGAKPVAFLDYYGCSKLDRSKGKEIISGIVEGCKLAGCELIGGETAEMPNHYNENNFDLVGFSMGVNNRNKIIDGSSIESGDIVLGLPSSGFHSNGYSLINEVIKDKIIDNSFMEKLLIPTRIYVNEILLLKEISKIKGMAHITGGGLNENLSRIANGKTICIDKSKWVMPEIFNEIKELGNISEDEMFNVFNCGVGFCIVLDKENAKKAMEINSELIEIGFVSDRNKVDFNFV